jgi:adenine phosphoribosyltransferase
MTIRIEDFLRVVPDFPKPGILFRDISPLLRAPQAYEYVIDQMSERAKDLRVDLIVAIESRGFLFGSPLALKMKKPLCIVRKPGKLPGETESVQYGLEYGVDMLHVQKGAISTGDSVLVVDDVLATGGTAAATGRLLSRLGGKVSGYLFLAELEGLSGRENLVDAQVEALVRVHSNLQKD